MARRHERGQPEAKRQREITPLSGKEQRDPARCFAGVSVPEEIDDHQRRIICVVE
jgi:hypothetical protein